MTPAAPGRRDDLKAYIEALTDRVVAAQPIARALVEGQKDKAELKEIKRQQRMANKFPNLNAVAGALDKLNSAIEDDAREVLEEIEAVHEKRKEVKAKAKAKTKISVDGLAEASEALEKLDAALGDNGGPPLPTSDGS